MLVGARGCYSRPDHPGEARHRWAAALAILLVGLSSGACSVTFPIVSLLSEADTTGSVRSAALSPLSPDLDEEDWRRAKNALALALDPQGSGAMVSWDNPDSAMRGTVTPNGQPFVRSDEVCRAFRATVIGKSTTSSLQGTACRPSGGDWVIQELKPAKKTT